jgi:reductive dehalogenase
MTRFFSSDWRDQCRSDRPDPYPVHILKRVDRPTTIIHDDQVQRSDPRENGFNRGGRGDFGPFIAREYPRFGAKHPLGGTLMTMTGVLAHQVEGEDRKPKDPSARSGDVPPMHPVAATKAPGTNDPVAMARHIKETAYFLRADIVGICELPPYAVYSHGALDGKPIELPHKYAIAILIDQDWRTAAASNGSDWISISMSFMSYSTSAFIACALADYIRRLGYPARAHHARNYQIVLPPILLWAGLGEMSRIGDIVVNPFLGPRFKAAVVTTDMPLAIDKPIDFGLQDFCDKCKKCARECPGGALSEGPKVMHNGYEKWPTDVKKCSSMRIGNQKGASCGSCLTVCPWNKPYTPFHRAISWMMRNVPVVRNFGIWGDDLMGYGKPDPKRKWWLDLEEVDGRLKAPGSEGNGNGAT